MNDKFSNSVMAPSAGLNLVADPLSFAQGEYSYMLNGAVYGSEGKNPSAHFLLGNVKAVEFITGFEPIGRTRISNDRECIFLVNPSNDDCIIGISDGAEFKIVVKSKELNFKITNQIQAVFDKDYSGKLLVIWVDDLNPVRYMDLDNVPLLNGLLDVEALAVFRQTSYANVSILDISNNGVLRAASYYVCVQYADENGNGLSSFTTPIGPIPIYRDSLTPPDFINGSADREPTSKAIRFKIDNLDQSFNYYNLGIVKSFSSIREAFIVSTNPIAQTEYLYTGTKINEISVDLKEIITPSVSYKSAKTISLSDGTLLLGNLKGESDFNLQPYVSKIGVYWQAKKELYDSALKSYANPLNCVYEVGYRRGEVYALGVVIRWTNGSKSREYPLISRELNKDSKGVVITRIVDQYNTLITSGSWDNYKHALSNDIYESGAIPERWRVYNTAFELGDVSLGSPGISKYGEFSYWESTDLYPNNSLIWGDNAGKPIRHFKMPDLSILPLTDLEGGYKTDDSPVHIYKLGIRLYNIEDVMNSLPDEVKNKMAGWEIVRGDRRGVKSVIASGIIHNMWMQNWDAANTLGIPGTYVPYTSGSTLNTGYLDNLGTDDIRLYANYPHNDLRPDYYIRRRGIEGDRIVDGLSNDRYRKDVFTFISPDTSFNKTLLLAGELRIHSEVYGVSRSRISFLDPYPDMKVKGDEANQMVYQNVSIAYYTNWKQARVGNIRRKLNECLYVPFNSTVGGGVRMPIYNEERESTVLVVLNSPVENTTELDTSRVFLSDPEYSCTLDKRIVNRMVASHYVSIVNNLANQYGSVFNTSFVYTNYDNFNVTNSSIVFGGDCFIGKFTQKRQFPMYKNLQVYMDWQDNERGVDLNTSVTIPGSRYYYLANKRRPSAGLQTNTECEVNSNIARYIPGLMIGIPVFFVESDTNLDLRLNGEGEADTFYPNLKDGGLTLDQWVGVKNVDKDNSFDHNSAYSESNDLYGYQTPDPFFDPARIITFHFDTRVLFSLTNSPESRFNNLLVFKPLNYYDFRRDSGELWNIREIGPGKVLFQLEHESFIVNKYLTIPVEGNKITLGSGKLFDNPPASLLRSDGGYVGSRSQWAFNNTPVGTFMIDSIRGAVYRVGQGLEDIGGQEADVWFIKNLPLNLIKEIPSFKNFDNPSNPDGVGYTSCYDGLNKTWILTKRDYCLVDKSTANDFSVIDGQLLKNGSPISLKNANVFEDYSWTFIFNSKTGKWQTWASFIPTFYSLINDRYFSYNGGFLWEHNKGLPRTFYGKRYPFIMEFPLTHGSGGQGMTHSCSWLTRAFPITNGVMMGESFEETYNKGVFYTENQSSGLLELTVQDENDLSTLFKAEKITTTSIESYLRFRDNTWQLNELVDLVRDHNLPFFTSSWGALKPLYYIDKIVEHSNIDYKRDYKTAPLIRDFWVKCRLIYDKDKDIQMHHYYTTAYNEVSIK